jgi:B12 binding domain
MATYYQRLLAGDEREACEVLESYLKEHSLQELYDSVLIPALSLAEQDRHQQNLDDSTVTFIYQTTRELVEELGLRREEYPPAAPKDNAKDKTKAGADVEVKAGQAIGHEPTAATRPQDIAPAATVPIKVVCIPARDDADEIVAMMLAQLLERAGCEAQVISLNRADVMLAEVSKEKPEVVCLSALPPFAMAHPRRLYSKLREQEPRLPILIGVWNYTDDATRAANEISRGEADHISTTLAQAVAEIKPGPPNQPGPEPSAEPGPAANQIARPDRSPATVGK